MISKEERQKLRKLCEKATLGPWDTHRCGDDTHIIEVNDSTGWKEKYPDAYIALKGGWGYAMNGDAEFIAAIPSLLDSLDEREANQKSQDEIYEAASKVYESQIKFLREELGFSDKVISNFNEQNKAHIELCKKYEALESQAATMRGVLTELARFDVDPKYLANGHGEVARKCREALSIASLDKQKESKDEGSFCR